MDFYIDLHVFGAVPVRKKDEILDYKADSYGNEKLKRKWTKSVFFGVFQSNGNGNGLDSYSQIRLSFS